MADANDIPGLEGMMGQPQQAQIKPATLKVEAFRAIEVNVDTASGNRGLELLLAAPLLILELWWRQDVAQEIGAKLMAPGVTLPGQNGGVPNGG